MRGAILTFILVLGFSASALAQQNDVFVDDNNLKARLFRSGQRLLANGCVDADTLIEQLKDAPKSFQLELESTEEPVAFQRNYEATVVFGSLYNCGRCNKEHLTTGGGVIVSSDGLVLTNYHVLNKEQQTYNFFVMTHDRKVHPVVEVLAANEANDIALVRIDAEGLIPAVVSKELAQPNSEIYLISHPHSRYFSTASGTVSRYSTKRGSKGLRRKWMDINAVFSQGSSGCGVFNDRGELTGLVSRKEIINSRDQKSEGQVEMVIRLCVPQCSIYELLGGE